MAALHPDKIWWTAAEIVEATLPDMPVSTSSADRMIKRNGWRSQAGFARRRVGSIGGGGWEYRWELFTDRARRKLLKDASVHHDAATPRNATEVHAWFDGLPDTVKAKAQERNKTLLMVLEMERTGLTRFLAVDQVARIQGVSDRTIWNWLKMVDGVDSTDWLCHLAPRHRAAKRNDKKAECDPEFFDRLKGDYLRLERPSFASAYRRTVKWCAAKGKTALPNRTARRRLNELVPRVTQILAREGYIGLARCFPPQTRDRTDMAAMEGVNADCHKFDVFVRWPGETKPSRAQIVAFQDLYSGKILSWRIDHSPNKVAVMAAFGDLVEDYGIPQHCLFDNGMEFANKWLTGGAKTRFRFKIREDEPAGVLTMLGIKIHWATPAHGQAKPIERAFRDFADDIAKDPRFAGAYVGNRPDAKPENYGNTAIPIEEFIQVVGEGVDEHNARLGRLSATAHGRSFDETFAESYATAPIKKASEEQRRLWLMGQEVLTLHKTHGRLSLHQNKYWSDWMNEFAGQKVVARFDPEDLHAGVHIYALDGAFLGFGACEEKVGFFDLTGAQDSARKRSAFRRAERKLLELHRPIGVAEIADGMNEVSSPAAALPEAKVVQAEFGVKPNRETLVERPAYQEKSTPVEAEKQATFVADFEAEKTKRDAAKEIEEEPWQRFKRALEIEQRSAAGQAVGNAEAQWLTGYQTTGEYRGQRRMHGEFGDQMFLD